MADPIPDADLRALIALVEKADNGDENDYCRLVDASLAAVPALAQEVLRLREALSRIFEAHTRTDLSNDPAYEHNAVRKEKEALHAAE